MKNKYLKDIFKKYTSDIPFDFSKIMSIGWKLDVADEEQLIFYQFEDNDQAQQKLFERSQHSLANFLVLNHEPDHKIDIPYIVIKDDFKSIMKEVCDLYFPIPHKCHFIGITGTNGKTTTVELLRQMLSLSHRTSITIGTLGVRDDRGTVFEFGMTTPGFMELRKIIYDFCHEKDFLIMEVSSHSLDQERIFGLTFEYIGWTNFTQDHLDYHKTFEKYFEAKLKILKYLKTDRKLFIPDTQKNLIEKVHGLDKRTEATLSNVQFPKGPFFETEYNKENFKLAYTIFRALLPQEKKTFETLNSPPGRMKFIEKENYKIVIDFAHTPDAIENICSGLANSFKNYSLVIVFGCGGNRDKTKRSLMGKAAEKWCHKIWLTSDNPRDEEPDQIIQDIYSGISNQMKVQCISDRSLAIFSALENLKSNEILIVAGKGHENYIESKGIKTPYSDEETVQRYFQSGNKND